VKVRVAHALMRAVSGIISTPCLAVCLLSSAIAQPPPTVNVTGGAVRGYLAVPGAVFKACLLYTSHSVGEISGHTEPNLRGIGIGYRPYRLLS